MSALGKFFKQGSWVLVQHGASRGLGVLVFYGISLFVVPEELGMMGLAWVFVAVCDALLGLGMPTAFLRKENVTEDDRSTLFWGLAGCGVAWTVLCVSLAPAVAWAFGEKELVAIIVVLSIRFPLRALDGVPLSMLMRDLQFKKLALLEVICTGLSGALGVFLAYKGFGVWSLVIRHVTYSALSPIVLYTIVPWRPQMRFNKVILREYLSFGIPLTVSGNLGWLVALQIEQAVVGAVLGPAALGILNFAKKPMDVAGQVVSSIRESVLLPLLVKEKSKSGSENRLAFKMYLGAMLAGVSIVFAITFFFPYNWFEDSQWKEAVAFFPLLSAVLCLHMVQAVFQAHLTFLGEVKFLLFSAVVETGAYGGLILLYANRGLNLVVNAMLVSAAIALVLMVAKLIWSAKRKPLTESSLVA